MTRLIADNPRPQTELRAGVNWLIAGALGALMWVGGYEIVLWVVGL